MRGNKKDYDFAGYVTKYNVLCTDGRTIMDDAFAHMDGDRVAFVYNHDHKTLENNLGYVDLESRPGKGLYGYVKTNNTPNGKLAKELVHSGSLSAFSIYANHLTEHNGDVYHGDVKEVSLVQAGANSEAVIDEFFEHGADGDTGMYFYNTDDDSELVIFHSDKDKKEEEDDEKEDSENEDDEEEDSENEDDEDEDEESMKKNIKHSDTEQGSGKTLKEAYDEMPDEYKKVCQAMVGLAISDKGGNESDDDEEDGGDEKMKHNAFEQDHEDEGMVLEHSDLNAIVASAHTSGSLKRAFNEYCIQHSIDPTGMNLTPAAATATQTYGVRDLDMLYPEYKYQGTKPEFIKRDTEWVASFMGKVKKVPFKRIKSMFANITEDEARAKGYIKGDKKATEVFELLGRTTDPQTIYKLQELDRDDILDVEDFDIVVWIKGEMQIMLEEEKARACLIGDGRAASNKYKIKEDHVRSIVNDVPLFNIKTTVPVKSGDTEEDIYKNFIKTALRARKNYKGSGNPILYTTEDVLTECLLLEDKMGHALYASKEALATKLRVSDIVTVEVMENAKVDSKDLMGVIVNPVDYTIGGDGTREKGMFEDFDIDFNQYKYLIETRMCGALMRPYSAITILKASSGTSAQG